MSMADPSIIAGTGAALVRGAFSEALTRRGLAVPSALAQVLGRLRIRTATQLVSYALSFPSALQEALGWSQQEVERAGRHLAKTLKLSPQDLDEFTEPGGVDVDGYLGRTAGELNSDDKRAPSE